MFIPLFDEEFDIRQTNNKRKILNIFTPIMSITILICLVIFIYQTSVKNINEFYQTWGTSVFKIINAERIGAEAYLSLITYAFVHGGIWHLLGNLWFLFIFGNNVEKRMGSLMFTVFYLSSAVFAALTHMFLLYPQEMLGQVKLTSNMVSIKYLSDLNTPLIGASGAISAVLGAYLRYFPGNNIVTIVFFFILTVTTIPAFVFIGIWLLSQIFNAIFNPLSNIAWFAHIGGFFYGYIFASIYKGKEQTTYEWQ